MFRQITIVAFALLSSLACTKAQPTTVAPAGDTSNPDDAFAGKPAVPNTAARTGDVTVCPYSGRKFVVAHDSPRWEYQGKTYVLCSNKALIELRKDPAKYLDGFAG